MRVVRVREHGGPEALQVETVPTPAPGPGEVRVRLEAAGVNFIDVYQRTGLYPMALPLAMGSEGAGVIEAVGEGVGTLAIGDRVAWASAQGSYATHVLARADVLVPVPESVSFVTAAAVMLQGMTAHYLTHDTFPLSAAHTCLVHAAAGGVGLLLTQLARRRGARVIGVVSTDDKAARARAAGCDDVLVAPAALADEVRRRTDGAGVDVVYDAVGAATWDASLRSLRRRGMMVSYGNASGPVPPFAPLVLNQLGSLYVTRPKLGDYVVTRAELLARAGDLFRWIAAGELSVAIHTELPLERAGEAHRLLESRVTSGKLVLRPE